MIIEMISPGVLVHSWMLVAVLINKLLHFDNSDTQSKHFSPQASKSVGGYCRAYKQIESCLLLSMYLFYFRRPSPWVDVAVLTNEPRRCDYYRQESVKPRGQCVFDKLNELPDGSLPINKRDCEGYTR